MTGTQRWLGAGERCREHHRVKAVDGLCETSWTGTAGCPQTVFLDLRRPVGLKVVRQLVADTS